MPKPARTAALIALLCMGTAACGGRGGSDADTSGRRRQAVEELHHAGLTDEEAACTTDALGVDVVVEAPDMATLADSQAYQHAVEGCTDGG